MIQILFRLVKCLYQRSRLQVCVWWAQRVRSGGPGTVHITKGAQRDTGDVSENTSIMGHTTSIVRYLFLIVIVIYFQLFCFSNLILSPYCLTVNC